MRGFVVTLSDGQTIKEHPDTYRWPDLKAYLKEKDLRIVGMHLQFDHQQVLLPNHAKVYFYSKKVEAWLGGPKGTAHYHGVGASMDGPDKVLITWYDGKNSKEETRKVDLEKDSFIS